MENEFHGYRYLVTSPEKLRSLRKSTVRIFFSAVKADGDEIKLIFDRFFYLIIGQGKNEKNYACNKEKPVEFEVLQAEVVKIMKEKAQVGLNRVQGYLKVVDLRDNTEIFHEELPWERPW